MVNRNDPSPEWLRRTVVVLIVCMVGFLPSQVLSQLAKGKAKFLGCGIESVFHSNFATYWNQVTPGNAGKWGSVEGVQDNYNWAPLDNIYNYALSNYFPHKHHTLVWGNQQPSWIASLDTASQRAQVEEWIRLVGERYPSMSFVDVVNEPFHAPPPYMNALGGTGITGWDWVITAFQWARHYSMRGVKLLVNEYNILQDNGVTTNYLRLIDTLRVRGLIDAIGVQGHYFEFKSPAGATPVYSYPISTLKYNLERLVATGLPVYITEFDINEADDNIQLQNYQTYFPLFWENPGVKGITLWGYVQGDIWKQNAYLVRSDGSERPALAWLRKYVASPLPPVPASPVGTTGEPRNPLLVWHPSVSALSYRIQVSDNGRFSPVIVDSVVADTLLRLDPLAANTAFFWHVSALNDSGASAYSATANFTTGDQTVDAPEREQQPVDFVLSQNYPNPFNPSTTIEFSLPLRTEVRLVLCNVLGQVVKEIAGGTYEAGRYRISIDASDLASGVYFYTIRAGTFARTKKLVVAR